MVFCFKLGQVSGSLRPLQHFHFHSGTRKGKSLGPGRGILFLLVGFSVAWADSSAKYWIAVPSEYKSVSLEAFYMTVSVCAWPFCGALGFFWYWSRLLCFLFACFAVMYSKCISGMFELLFLWMSINMCYDYQSLSLIGEPPFAPLRAFRTPTPTHF